MTVAFASTNAFADGRAQATQSQQSNKTQAHKVLNAKLQKSTDKKLVHDKNKAKHKAKAKSVAKAQKLQATPVPSNPSDYNSKELYRSMIQNAPVSKVDPYTGALIIHIPIVDIPGNDGLNLHLVWSHRSGTGLPHMGDSWMYPAILNTENRSEDGGILVDCSESIIFIDPTGHTHKLYLKSGNGGTCDGDVQTGLVFESVDHWHAALNASSSGSTPWMGYQGNVYAPDGTTYTVINSWNGGYAPVSPVSTITSPQGGEVINYAYNRIGADQWQLKSMNMGKFSVGFTYNSDDSTQITTSDGDQSLAWKLQKKTFHDSNSGVSRSINRLTSIELPNNESWQIGWQEIPLVRSKTFPPTPCQDCFTSFQVTSLIYPAGGKSSYKVTGYLPVLYDGQTRSDFSVTPRLATTFVTQQTNSGPGLTTSTWSYNYGSIKPQPCWPYSPGYPRCNGPVLNGWAVVGRYDGPYTTTVTSPHKKIVYQFEGHFTPLSVFPILYGDSQPWNNGLTDSTSIYQVDGTSSKLLQQTKYNNWTERHFGNNGVSGHPNPGAAQAELGSRTITRDGVTYMTNYSYDSNGLVTGIKQSSPQGTRFEGISNFDKQYTVNNIKHWLLTPQNETWYNGADSSAASDNRISRDISANTGELNSQTTNGVKTSYTYDGGGNIKTITNALGHVTTLEGYMAGMPKKITDSAKHVFYFDIASNGTITSYTDALGHKTSYGYDSLYRLTSLIPPAGDPIKLTWGNYTGGNNMATRTVTRGNYKQETWFNGFGQPKGIISYDNNNPINRVEMRYDAYGNQIFKSYPLSTTATNDQLLGVYTTRDALGRITSVTAPLPLSKVGDGLSPYQG